MEPLLRETEKREVGNGGSGEGEGEGSASGQPGLSISQGSKKTVALTCLPIGGERKRDLLITEI